MIMSVMPICSLTDAFLLPPLGTLVSWALTKSVTVIEEQEGPNKL
jgi:hypothetical protein